MAVVSYCYYEKLRRTMRTTIMSYLLEYFYSFSAAELNNIESEGEIQKFSCEESNYGDSNDEDIEQMYIWQVK